MMESRKLRILILFDEILYLLVCFSLSTSLIEIYLVGTSDKIGNFTMKIKIMLYGPTIHLCRKTKPRYYKSIMK